MSKTSSYVLNREEFIYSTNRTAGGQGLPIPHFPRGFLKTRFSWQYYYYTLTPEGLEYLRDWLHLPAEIVPATHIKQQRSHAPPRGMMGGDDRERRGGGRGGPRGDREGGYRRRDAGEGKEGGAPGEYTPSFRGGFGRGRGAPPQSQ